MNYSTEPKFNVGKLLGTASSVDNKGVVSYNIPYIKYITFLNFSSLVVSEIDF